MQVKSIAILWTFIKLPFVIFEWLFYTGFTVVESRDSYHVCLYDEPAADDCTFGQFFLGLRRGSSVQPAKIGSNYYCDIG